MTAVETGRLVRDLEEIAAKYVRNREDQRDAVMKAITDALRYNAVDIRKYAMSSIKHRSIDFQRQHKVYDHSDIHEYDGESACKESRADLRLAELLVSFQPVFDSLTEEEKEVVARRYLGVGILSSADKNRLHRAREKFKSNCAPSGLSTLHSPLSTGGEAPHVENM